eukprot:UN4270
MGKILDELKQLGVRQLGDVREVLPQRLDTGDHGRKLRGGGRKIGGALRALFSNRVSKVHAARIMSRHAGVFLEVAVERSRQIPQRPAPRAGE